VLLTIAPAVELIIRTKPSARMFLIKNLVVIIFSPLIALLMSVNLHGNEFSCHCHLPISGIQAAYLLGPAKNKKFLAAARRFIGKLNVE
jgi:hypothetical protein